MGYFSVEFCEALTESGCYSAAGKFTAEGTRQNRRCRSSMP